MKLKTKIKKKGWHFSLLKCILFAGLIAQVIITSLCGIHGFDQGLYVYSGDSSFEAIIPCNVVTFPGKK